MSLAMVDTAIGSRPVMGSSYNIKSGSSTTARANATLRAMPPESSCGMRYSIPPRPTALSLLITRRRIRGSGRSVCSRTGVAMFSKTVKSVNRAPSCRSTPMLRRKISNSRSDMLETNSPLISMVPSFGRSWPEISRSIVVLPTPLGPMNATMEPRRMSMLTPSRMVVRPRRNTRSLIRMTGS